jgi:ribosomal protein S18 acetylase RimI-like enzyme
MTIENQALEIRRLFPDWAEALGRFFADLKAAGDETTFHPHPLTRECADRICAYQGLDLYYAAGNARRIAAYGMLRGWDEGYETPSLGIAVQPSYRGQGLGSLMMAFLHSAARSRGARQVRLKVYASNAAARLLYERLGYVWANPGNAELVGILKLRE